MDTKVCNTCNIEKDITCFAKGINKYKGRVSEYYYNKCKECDRERVNKLNAKSRAKHRERNKLYQLKYNQRPGRKEAQAEYDRIYYNNNKEKKKARAKAHTYRKREIDPTFRLKQSISGNIRQTIKKNGSKKNGQSIFRYLSYSIEELKIYLENQFESWMTWENWGLYRLDTWDDNDPTTWTWQLDHIIPHSTFHYTSMESEEFRACWNLSNLRPLSAKQNLIDGNRR
jgi:hypothetical protein